MPDDEDQGSITAAARRAVAQERSAIGAWVRTWAPLIAAVVVFGAGLVGQHFALRDGARKAEEAIQILHGDPRSSQPGLVEQVRTNQRELERRRLERASSDAEVLRRLEAIQMSQGALERSVLERLTRLETKIEGR